MLGVMFALGVQVTCSSETAVVPATGSPFAESTETSAVSSVALSQKFRESRK